MSDYWSFLSHSSTIPDSVMARSVLPLMALTPRNSVIKINYPGSGNNSQFAYDGLGLNTTLVEKNSGTTTSTKQFVWCGQSRCEARDAASSLLSQYFSCGQTISTTPYYYSKDHLGSVHELTDASSVIQAQYIYDSYGRVTRISENHPSDFQFCAYYFHAPSFLLQTVYRVFSAVIGKWLSRDLIGEDGGINLYQYSDNDPVDSTDYLGLKPLQGGINVNVCPLGKRTPHYDYGGGKTGTQPPPPGSLPSTPPPLIVPPINNNPNPDPSPPPFNWTNPPIPHVPGLGR